jgi:hypothetical protein
VCRRVYGNEAVECVGEYTEMRQWSV